MKDKRILILLTVLLVLATGTSIYLGLWVRDAEQEKLELQAEAEAVAAYLTDYSVELSDSLNETQAQVATLEEEQRVLTDQYNQLQAQLDETAGRMQLYEDQKYFFVDALDWLRQRAGYGDLERAVRAFSEATGEEHPESCEVLDSQRYLKYGDRETSTMFVITPEKMGWSPYTYWSIRENVVFGPDHFDEANYVGSRGYEFRYPLATTAQDLPEVHTTINVYSVPITADDFIPEDYIQVVPLRCGINGYITVSSDEAQTVRIGFPFASYDANVKVKYLFDTEAALPILEQAANRIIEELTEGW